MKHFLVHDEFLTISDMDTYQHESHKTAVYPNVGNNINYVTLGLCDEAGEVAGKIKKLMRDDGGVLTEERKEAIIKELGDVMWYIAEMCTTLDISLHDVAFRNIDKLQERQSKGTLKGDGDNR
jgi:NTP pyrophosphatase (non-canonical NTP hydrolase)